MAITLDQATGTTIGTSNSYTWTHTCASNATILFVFVAVEAVNTSYTNTVTYNSISPSGSLAKNGTSGVGGSITLYWWFNPSPGANTVSVSNGVNSRNQGGGSVSFISTNQSQFNNSVASGITGNNTLSISGVTSTVAPVLLFSAAASSESSSLTGLSSNLSNNLTTGTTNSSTLCKRAAYSTNSHMINQNFSWTSTGGTAQNVVATTVVVQEYSAINKLSGIVQGSINKVLGVVNMAASTSAAINKIAGVINT